ncbi:hypothetical protein IQ07DRAFT_684279 [Pyrenochaeta sp. DS3sAY3a]|nr:hypothetical protein IQ07DRAFT_684279 [Pyrenochaeta sp. DS3sAY3a]
MKTRSQNPQPPRSKTHEADSSNTDSTIDSHPINPSTILPSPPLTKPQRMHYRIGRGETSVLTFQPYKSLLLPHWRFKNVPIARSSSANLHAAFEIYAAAHDFVGMDMARKFLQMGMTRAKRYANYRGGRKYDGSGGLLEKGCEFEGREEKEGASLVFRGVWERVRRDERYVVAKEGFLREQREWDRMMRGKETGKGDGVEWEEKQLGEEREE